MRRHAYDVVIVGGSIAGCVCAILLVRRGLTVAVIERRERIEDYKRLCTHFIQPVALPVWKHMSLDAELEAHGAVRTKAAFWTPQGMIDPPGDYTFESATAHGYNIERRVLDPLLRTLAMRESAVELILGRTLHRVEVTRGCWQLEARDGEGESMVLRARCVVAADGRASTVAALVGNAGSDHPNDRGAYFSYFDGIPAPSFNRSLFLRAGPQMGFLYPLGNGRTLLAVYYPKHERSRWEGETATTTLLQFFASMPNGDSVRHAVEVARGIGYSHYPNRVRSPVHAGIAFIGDAALSLDPMSGVGCAFAVVSADLLAHHVGDSLRGGPALEEALRSYADAFKRTFDAHSRGVMADSIVSAAIGPRSDVYRQIAADTELQHAYIALTGRLVTPQSFQKIYVERMLAKRASVRSGR